MPYKDPEKNKEFWRTRHVRKRAERNARQSQYQKDHKEQCNATKKAWRKKNQKKVRLQDRQYKKKNKLNNRLNCQRRRTRKRNLPRHFTVGHYKYMLAYWNHACAICGNQEGLFWTLALDHWIPLSSPDCPGTIPGNILPLCHGDGGCNNKKWNRDAHTWLLGLYSRQRVSHIEKSIATYFTKIAQHFERTHSSIDDEEPAQYQLLQQFQEADAPQLLFADEHP